MSELGKYTVAHLLIFNKLLLPVMGTIPNLMNNGTPWKDCSWLCVCAWRECWQPCSNSVQVTLRLPASTMWVLFFTQWCKTLTPLSEWGENRIFPEDAEIPFV